MKKNKIIASLIVIALLFQYVATLSYAYENITEEIKNDEVALLNDEISEDDELIIENEISDDTTLTYEVNDEDMSLDENLNEEDKNSSNEDISDEKEDSKEENEIEEEQDAEDVEEKSEEIIVDDTVKDDEISNKNVDQVESEDTNLNKEQVSEENSKNEKIEENKLSEIETQSLDEQKIYVGTFESVELKGTMCIDTQNNNPTYNIPSVSTITINGWAVSTDEKAILKLYINNVCVDANLSRISRADVDSLVSPGYGGTSKTPKAGFSKTVDISTLGTGKHTLKIEQISSNGSVISESQKDFYINDVSKSGVMCIDSVNDGERYNLSNVKSLTLNGWAVSYIQNATINIYMNDVKIISNANRISRTDVDKLVSPGYGGTSKTPKAGFSEVIDISKYKYGAYTLKIEQVDTDGYVISSLERKIYIDKVVTGQEYSANMCIDYPTGNPTYNIETNKSFEVAGWAVSTDKNATVMAYVNNVPVDTNIERISRTDVDRLVSPGYGGTSSTPKAGFVFTVDISKYTAQNYTLTVEELSYGGAVIGSISKNFTVKNESVKGSICIDYPTDSQISYVPSTSTINVSGWAVSNSSDVIVKAYINNVCVIQNMTRISRTDVDRLISPNYGGTSRTPKAGFTGDINISNLKAGTYTLKVEETTSSGTIITSSEKKITIKNDVLEGSICIDNPSDNVTYILPDNNKISIAGWAVSTDSKSTVNAYINNNLVISNMSRSSRSDVDRLVSPSYGGTSRTPKAGFYGTIDISKYTKGTYTLKIEEVSSTGKVICSQEKQFTIKYADYKGVICIDYPADKQLQTNASKTLLIQGWVLSDDSEDIIQIKVNGNSVSSSSISRYSRSDVEAISGPYGGKSKNSKAGFTYSLDTSGYAEGIYTITVNLLNRWGELLKSESKTIEVSYSRYSGVDVSAHNGTLNWQSLKNQGITFAILRIGYGQNSNQLDSTFEYNYEQCKKYGIKVGIYLYSYAMSTEDSVKEAQNTLNWLKGRNLDLPVYYDIENKTEAYYQLGLSKDTLTNMAITYMDIIQNAGYKAGLYSSKSWLESKFDMNRIENNYSVWVAHYTSMLTTTYTGKYDFWQYREGEKGASGILGLDCDYGYRKTFFE